MDGLWQGPSALTEDFGTIAYRMQLLGFNTVRLPMSFQVRDPDCVRLRIVNLVRSQACMSTRFRPALQE